MKILLTGVSGTGKSTIAAKLNERGVTAIDLHDVPELFFWQNLETGEKEEYTPVNSIHWFDTVDRLCDVEKIKKTLSQYEDVVAAGSTSNNNQEEFLSYFDKVILLQASPETLLQRMRTRVNKSGFGKTKAEQEDNIEWQKEFEPYLISLGAVPFSTEGNLDDVVDRLIPLLN